MKVTQEEFDVKRKELGEVQAKIQDIQRTINMYTLKSIKSEIFRNTLQAWLQDADIEKDLSVDVREVKMGTVSKRIFGMYKHKGYYLNSMYNWEIRTDDEGIQVAIPTKVS